MKTPGHCDCCGEVSVRKLFWHFLCPKCAKHEVEEIKSWSCEKCGHNIDMPSSPGTHSDTGSIHGAPHKH